jgi:hypothetical protein
MRLSWRTGGEAGEKDPGARPASPPAVPGPL